MIEIKELNKSYGTKKVLENLNDALDISWKGMLSIFLAMLIIYFVIIILNAATKKKEK